MKSGITKCDLTRYTGVICYHMISETMISLKYVLGTGRPLKNESDKIYFS